MKIYKFGYSYLPTYGRYKGNDGVTDEYEPSFYVFNHLPNGQAGNFDELKAFAIDMCQKYEQDSELCHRNNVPITKDRGEKYYSEHLTDSDTIGKRFTDDISFNECFVNPMPCQITERLIRRCEIMIWV